MMGRELGTWWGQEIRRSDGWFSGSVIEVSMRIAEVIGTVTLSRCHPRVSALRWIIGVPFSLRALQEGRGPDGEDVVIVDHLGAGHGSRIGFSEGVEATAPYYPEQKPVDAYCACILDNLVIQSHERIQA
jgi:ethanolamine utilization protein EutN